MGIKIIAYHYNTLCDTYGCSGMARVSLSMDDTPGSMKHNICNECLAGIVAAAPLHMVLAREDVKAHIQAPPSLDTFTATSVEDVETAMFPPDIETFKDIPVADAETVLIKYYNWQDLKKLARDLKIENCNTIKRDVLEAEILKRL